MPSPSRPAGGRSFVAFLLLVFGSAFSIPTAAVEHTLLSDLAPEVRDTILAALENKPDRDDPRRQLEAVFQSANPYAFRAGPLEVETDRRWFATVPGDDPAAPLLELRRWPGDSVLALYSLAGEAPPANRAATIPGAQLEPSESTVEGTWRWDGTVETPFGTRPAAWIERRISGASCRLGALILPGDAGLGHRARFDLLEELQLVLERLQVNVKRWAVLPGLPPDTALVPPRLDSPYGEGSERADAWQVVEGVGYSIGLPPGLRARRLDIGIPAPAGEIPGGLLWMRGRYTDEVGERVVIGDEVRAGYLAEVRPRDAAWVSGKIPPRGVPKAKLVKRDAYNQIEVRRTEAASVSAERWSEPGFNGEWLVFRIDNREYGVEIGLPVVAGRQSLSLYWLPLTWRAAGRVPAPPPVDPSERFGISFERFTPAEQKRHPWSEGFLRVPGLRMELPKRWWPSAMLRSKNGFPVRFVDGTGQTVGSLSLLPEGAPEMSAAVLEKWESLPRPGAFRARSVYRRDGGIWLFVTHDGNGFLLEPVEGARFDPEDWRRMAESALVVLPRT